MDQKILEFKCSAIEKEKFRIEFTGRGKDISPEFVINNLSPNAESLVITLEDMSHPIKRFTHWIIWNIPAADIIQKAVPRGKSVPNLGNAIQGIGYGFHRYAGPKPPKGKSHKYCFTVYVLNCFLDLKPFSFKRTVLQAAHNHIIQQGTICGYFE